MFTDLEKLYPAASSDYSALSLSDGSGQVVPAPNCGGTEY